MGNVILTPISIAISIPIPIGNLNFHETRKLSIDDPNSLEFHSNPGTLEALDPSFRSTLLEMIPFYKLCPDIKSPFQGLPVLGDGFGRYVALERLLHGI